MTILIYTIVGLFGMTVAITAVSVIARKCAKSMRVRNSESETDDGRECHEVREMEAERQSSGQTGEMTLRQRSLNSDLEAATVQGDPSPRGPWLG